MLEWQLNGEEAIVELVLIYAQNMDQIVNLG